MTTTFDVPVERSAVSTRSPGSESGSTVDLSHTLESGMPVYPGTPLARLEPAATVAEDGYRTTRIDIDSHTGTHIDAPAHMLADGPPLEAYPLETFRFAAAVADCRPLEPREAIDAGTLRKVSPAEVVENGGESNEGTDVDLLVVRTGWETHWGDERYFDHPFLTADAAAWLATHDLHLGLDTLNPDPTPTESENGNRDETDDEPHSYPVHHTLFENDRLILENLRGLEAIPERFELHAYPLAFDGSDASPVRAVALFE